MKTLQKSFLGARDGFISLLLFTLIGFGIHDNYGQYHSVFIFLVVCSFLSFIFFFFYRSSSDSILLSEKMIFFVAFIFLIRLVTKPGILYGQSKSLSDLVLLLLVASSILVGVAYRFVWVGGKEEKRVVRLLIFACGLLLMARGLVPFWSPSPYIDVYTTLTSAVNVLLEFQNPYTKEFENIYKRVFDYKAIFPYPPAALYWITFFQWLFGDFRVGHVFGEAGTAACVLAMGQTLGFSKVRRWLFTLLWLSFPVTLFITEQGWLDGPLVFFTAVTCLCLLKGKWALTGVALGCLLGVKQYGILTLALTLFWAYRQLGFRPALRIAFFCSGTFLILCTPFLLWNAQALINNTIFEFIALPFRPDSFSIVAFIYKFFGVVLSQWFSGPILAIFFCALAVYWWKTPPVLLDWCKAHVIALMLFFLFGKQSFANYFYFISFSVLLCVMIPRKQVTGQASS